MMTKLAAKINEAMTTNPNATAEDILAMDIGSSVFEVEFIMEQIRQFA